MACKPGCPFSVSLKSHLPNKWFLATFNDEGSLFFPLKLAGRTTTTALLTDIATIYKVFESKQHILYTKKLMPIMTKREAYTLTVILYINSHNGNS